MSLLQAPVNELSTPRLRLRRWLPSDLAPLAELNADPLAMQFMLRPLSATESGEFAAGAEAFLEAHGFGLWALERRPDAAFLGCVGLNAPSFSAHFTPCVEVLWRLLPRHWGCGYATEAARACLGFAFETLQLAQVVAFTVPANVRSRSVMRRLGMTHDARDDFDHPRVPAGHPLRPHVLYRLPRSAWPDAQVP